MDQGRKGLVYWTLLGFLVAVAAQAAVAQTEEGVDHSEWDVLLHQYVRQGRVDYQALRANRPSLDRHLADLGAVDIRSVREDAPRKAFWLNAYNVCVVQSVLNHYPFASVQDIKGFFDQERHRVGRRNLTLNEIEREARALGDARVHVAINRASTSGMPRISSRTAG